MFDLLKLLPAANVNGMEDNPLEMIIMIIVYLALIIPMIAGQWKTFEKAGKPGWGCLVPVYNVVLMVEIAGKSSLWIILAFIPCVQIVILILIAIAIAKNIGKSDAFGLGLAFLGPIFYPILGFGDAKYKPVKQN